MAHGNFTRLFPTTATERNLLIPLLTVEFATVGKTQEGKVYHHLWNADEINALLKQHGLAKVDDEPEAGDIK